MKNKDDVFIIDLHKLNKEDKINEKRYIAANKYHLHELGVIKEREEREERDDYIVRLPSNKVMRIGRILIEEKLNMRPADFKSYMKLILGLGEDEIERENNNEE